MALIGRYMLDAARCGREYGTSDVLTVIPTLNYEGGCRPCSGPFDMAGTKFNGEGGRAYLPDLDAYSISTTGYLSVAVWVRADAPNFVHKEGKGYVHLVSKGNSRQGYEWCLRMYSADNTEVPNRGNRISAYSFNVAGDLGAGSYWQPAYTIVGAWHHVIGTFSIPDDRVQIFIDGALMDFDPLSGYGIRPTNGGSPVELACRDGKSYFNGGLCDLRLYDHVLSADEARNIALGLM